MLDAMPILFDFSPAISTGDMFEGIIAALSILGAVIIFMLQNRKANALQRIEIYQRLELAASELFSFEAEHAAILDRYRDEQPDPEKFGRQWPALLAHLRDGEVSIRDAALRRELVIVSKFYEKTLNLFEIAARFRFDGVMDERVFGSWVIWYYDICREWAFRWYWPGLKSNYMREIRRIFDYPVTYFQFSAELEDPAEKARHATTLEADFFVHVGRLAGCEIVTRWPQELRRQEAALDSQVKANGMPDYPKWPRFKGYGKAPVPSARPAIRRSPFNLPDEKESPAS